MTDSLRSWRNRVIAAGALAVLAVGGVVAAKKAGPGVEVREIRLVVRDMTYYAAGSSDPNPTLVLTGGERVRIVLSNDDPGYSHNLTAPALGLSTELLARGESQSIVFTVPDLPGVYPYACAPHSQMMRGTIAIE